MYEQLTHAFIVERSHQWDQRVIQGALLCHAPPPSLASVLRSDQPSSSAECASFGMHFPQGR